jgi:hypothetical protein
LHDKIVGQHVSAYFSSHHQAIVLILRRDDGLKQLAETFAQLICLVKFVYEVILNIDVIDCAAGMCHTGIEIKV